MPAKKLRLLVSVIRVSSHDAQRIRIDRAKPRSDPFVGRARAGALSAPSANIFFGLTRRHERRQGRERKSRRAADRQRRSCESGRFGVPATELRAGASLSLGKLKSRTRPDSAVKAAYMIRWRPRRPVAQRRQADDVARIRVLTITITAPQHEQSIAGRSLRGGVKRLGSNFSKRCSKPIRRLQLACRKPKLRARRKPLGSTCWRISQRKSAPGASAFPTCRSWRCDSGSSPGHSRRRGCPVHG
jgi:hypothetical protein